MGIFSLMAKAVGYFGKSKINDKGIDLGKNSVRNSRSNSNSNYLENKIAELDMEIYGDSRVNLADTVPEFSRDLYKLAHRNLKNANGDLAGKIYEFVREFVFNSDRLDYGNIEDAVKYLKILSNKSDGEAKKAAETAVTVMNYLNNYLTRQSERGDVASSQGLKNYLFGERGVLTQKRLNDMRKASDYLTKNDLRLKEKKNYKFRIGKDSLDVLNVSYTKDENGKIFSNINDDDSLGMCTGYGKIYWEMFNNMFDPEGKVDTRASVTKYVKKSLASLNKLGQVDFIRHLDWKKNSIDDYAEFVN